MKKTSTLPMPKSQVQEILYELLTHQTINRRGIMITTGCLNVTSRITELRKKGLVVDCVLRETHNKFGRKVEHGLWKLADKEAGKLLYLKMVKEEILTENKAA